MEKQYTPYFKDPFFECSDCKNCASKSRCFQENLSEKCEKMKEAARKFMETCPEGSVERSGQCAKKDLSGYLKGHCPAGAVWDPDLSSNGKCRPHTDKKK